MSGERLAQDTLERMTEHVVARSRRIGGEEGPLSCHLCLVKVRLPAPPGRGGGPPPGGPPRGPGARPPARIRPSHGDDGATQRFRGYRERVRVHPAGATKGAAYEQRRQP